MQRIARLFQTLQSFAFARVIVDVFQRFLKDDCPRNAAALTYTSLFAVVPLLTVTYSMLAALPVFRGVGEQLQGMLFDHFVPATGQVVKDYMGDFAQQARQLTLVGVIFLIITATLMIINIEKAFNAIWRVEKPRRGLQAFLIYWTVLTLGPLLLGAGLVLSSYLTSLPLLEKVADPIGGGALLWNYLPFIFSTLAFTLLYWAVPHCHVRFRHAASGGLAMALLFEIAKAGFSWFVTSFPSYELVYGAFAAFPLFLLWMYVSWLLILLCAEWVAMQGLPEEESQIETLEPGLQLLRVLQVLWQAFAQAEGVDENRLRSLAGSQNASLWQERLQWLQSHHWIVFDVEREVWLPGRDFSRISFADWLEQLPWRLPPLAFWPEQLLELKDLTLAQQEVEAQQRQVFSKPVSHFLETQEDSK
ncbi:YihY family inner membrane protein [Marinospirillum perlucidum]|uniref:YihY family inner membrane protein n=1 Tax=Marinospirillum perlucidum TaxID=1982602 RepID=UPI000DF298BB|nr:YihY family inner membrane protein [Marinospirillum perlucidum]